MIKKIALVIGVVFLFPCCLFAAQTDAQRAESFLLQSKKLPATERVDRAKATIENSTDDVVVAEAVYDLSRFWNNPEEKLAVIEEVLSKVDTNSKSCQRAEMAKAHILARLDRKAESRAIFEKGVAEGWERALHFYHNSLWETGDYPQIAIDTYKRLAETPDTDHSGEYQRERDFVGMFDSLRAMRALDPAFQAIDTVYPQLKDSESRPLAKPFAEAVCLAADDRYSEALVALDTIQDASDSGKYKGPDESQNLPFLRAAALFFEGRDPYAARAQMRRYMDLTADNPFWAMSRISYFLCTMEHSDRDGKNILELTSMLLDCEYMTDPAVRSKLQDWQLASILGWHQKGLTFRGRWEESADLCLKIMDQYYPQTITGANTALGIGLYVSWHDKDRDGAERILRAILEEAPYDGVAVYVLVALAEIADARGDRAKALTLLDEAFDRMGTLPYGRVPLVHNRQNALQLQNRILGR